MSKRIMNSDDGKSKKVNMGTQDNGEFEFDLEDNGEMIWCRQPTSEGEWCQMLSEDIWKRREEGMIPLEMAAIVEKLLILTGAKFAFRNVRGEKVTVYRAPKVDGLTEGEVNIRKARANGRIFQMGEIMQERQVALRMVAGNEPLESTRKDGKIMGFEK